MSRPTRTLVDRPDLDQLKRQAKDLLKAFVAGDAAAVAEVNAHYGRATAATFALSDAQLVLARAHGYESWPKLKAYVDGVTVRRLVEAVRAGDVPAVESMIAKRPEIVNFDVSEVDEHHAIHHAVMTRQPEMVRRLIQLGADPRAGIYPHRHATTAVALARERGYDEIVAILRDDQRRPPAGFETRSAVNAPSRETGLVSRAVAANSEDTLRQLLESGLDPDESGTLPGVDEVIATWGEPLRECAIEGRLPLARLLLDHGANPNTNVYAATSALYEAYKRRDTSMIALLETHGGRLDAIAIADLALIEPARRLLDENPALVSDVLWGAMSNSSSDLVRLALERIDWPREDPRWYRHLENGMYSPVHVENF